MRPDSTEGFVTRQHVHGAPLALGMRVLVRHSLDESYDARFSGRLGVVTGYVYDSPRDQFPHLPLLLVRVPNLGEEVFFASELHAPMVARELTRADVLAA